MKIRSSLYVFLPFYVIPNPVIMFTHTCVSPFTLRRQCIESTKEETKNSPERRNHFLMFIRFCGSLSRTNILIDNG